MGSESAGESDAWSWVSGCPADTRVMEREAQVTAGSYDASIRSSKGRWYRSREQALAIRLVAAVFVPCWAMATVIVLEKIPSPLATLLVVVLPGWAFAWAIVRAGWMGVQVTDDGARVRNLVRTREIPWTRIDRFSVGKTQLLPAAGLAHLTDGTVIPISGIQPRNILFFPNDNSALDLVAELNTVRDARAATAQLA